MANDFPHKTTLGRKATGGYMNRNAFDYLIKEINFSAHKQATVEALRIIYVEGLDRSTAMEMTGVESSGLTKAIRRFEAAVEEFVKKQGFVHEDYVLTEPLSALARFGELITLNRDITSKTEMEEVNKLAEELLVKLSNIYSNK